VKTTKKLFSVLTLVLAVVALVLYFLPFGRVILADNSSVTGVGAEFCFGSLDGKSIYTSSKLLFTLILTAFTVLFAALSLKYKGTRWATFGFSAVAAVFMLVVATSSAARFIDYGGVANAVGAAYVNMMPLIMSITLFLTSASSVAYLLIADKLAVMEEGSGKLTIPKRIVKFLKDYKSEFKKIVWPNFRTVMKNTLIVFLMCAAVGLFIWLIDFGLDALLKLIYK
jgi:preprotein translocase subunit SecE